MRFVMLSFLVLSTPALAEKPPAPAVCASTHVRVGWTATLSTKYHKVSGTMEVVDDCTVVIRNFTYDGTGLDVRCVDVGIDFGSGAFSAPAGAK